MFVKAEYLQKDISVIAETDERIRLKVGNSEVDLFYRNHQLWFWCDCKSASMRPKLLCSHAIAAIKWIKK